MSRKQFLEALFITFILTSSIIIPIIRAELFPYSSFQLFTDAPQKYATYTVVGHSGKELPLEAIQLHRNYYGIVKRKPFARIKPFSHDRWGEVLENQEIASLIKEKAPKDDYPYKVKIVVTGVRDNKVQTIEERTFMVKDD